MSGQFGFQATDPVPPMNDPIVLDAENIEELGFDLCLTAARRIRADRDETFDPSLIRDEDLLP